MADGVRREAEAENAFGRVGEDESALGHVLPMWLPILEQERSLVFYWLEVNSAPL
jgi:hypothetical protein